jgi:hypothetical protein
MTQPDADNFVNVENMVEDQAATLGESRGDGRNAKGETPRHFDPIGRYRDSAEIPPRRWLYGRHYILGSVSATIADGGMGKTNLSIAEGIAMAIGRNILDIDVPEPQRVLYWNGEEPIDEIERRVHAVLQHYGIDRSEIADKFFMMSGLVDRIRLAHMHHGNLIINDADFAAVEDVVKRLHIGVLLFDPFVSLHRIPENDNTNIEELVGLLAALAHRCRISIDLDHHVRKSQGGAEITVADARGAGALVNKARTVRVLNRMTPAQAQAAKVKDHREFIRADNGKANYAPAVAATWFKMIPIALPNGDSVAALEPWKYPGAFDTVRPEHIETVRAMIRSSNNFRIDSRSPEWVGRVIADVVGFDADDEADRKSIKKIIDTWIDNKVLFKVPRKDEKRKSRVYVAADPQDGGNVIPVDFSKRGTAPDTPAAPDPNEQRNAATLTALGLLLTQWKATIGVGETRSLQDVIDNAPLCPNFEAALVAVAPFDDRPGISNVRLARWLRDFNEVPVDGLMLRGGGVDEKGSPLWTLVEA